ncbi:MAG: phage baseplate protein [Pikeienuella sp.]
MGITDYDSTAANNTDVNGVNIAENCSPANINNAIREVMADLAGVVDLFYPVGSLCMSSDSANPSLRFPGTTWVAAAVGRAVVGVGTSDTADAFAWTSEQKRGLETHTLTVDEMPAHTHDDEGQGAQTLAPGVNGAVAYDANGETGATGGDDPHNNIQPSQAYYIWKRTA